MADRGTSRRQDHERDFPRQSLSEHSGDGASLREQSRRDPELERLKSLVRDGTLLEPPPTSDGTTETCVNINEEGAVGPTLSVVKDLIRTLWPDLGTFVLEGLRFYAKLSGIKSCTGSQCQRNKEIILKTLHGRSTWCLSLLEWMVQYLACWSTAFITSQKSQYILRWADEISILPDTVEKPEGEESHMLTDCLIHDMAAWLVHAQRGLGSNDWKDVGTTLASWKSPDLVLENEFNKTIEKAEALGICKNRLWNLVSCCPRGWRDLPALLAMLDPKDMKRAGLFKHTETLDNLAQTTLSIQTQASDIHTHDACAPDLCHFSSLDSTRVGQRHKCPNQSCSLITLPSIANEGSERLIWRHNVQSSRFGSQIPACTPFLSDSDGDYVAISHVWSDGTGVGVQGQGRMNSCLFSYFSDIAQKLGCSGLWWDAVSVPTDRTRKAHAIRNMQLYFSSAKHTVVHDEYLLRIPWKDDGTPCLAVVLSPWYTRGWTAVELAASKSVKALFGNPHDQKGPPVIKDLETEVLATLPHCSLGHFTASFIIRDLWGIKKVHADLLDLVRTLRTRSNSWPRDRVIVAAHLAGVEPDVDAVDMQTRVLRQIICSYRNVDSSILLHGSPTIEEHGPLSWCPSNLLSVRPLSLSRGYRINRSAGMSLRIDQDTGALWGSFYASDATGFSPNTLEFISMHPSVHRRMKSAFSHSENLLLLLTDTSNYCLVVRAMGLREEPVLTIECDWVGAALYNASHNLESSSHLRYVNVSIGSQIRVTNAVHTAKELLQEYLREAPVFS